MVNSIHLKDDTDSSQNRTLDASKTINLSPCNGQKEKTVANKYQLPTAKRSADPTSKVNTWARICYVAAQ